MNSYLLWGILGVVGVVMLYVFVRSGKFLKSFSFSAISGLCGLFVTYGVGLYTVPLLVISPISIAICTILGLPGVISLLLVKLLTGM